MRPNDAEKEMRTFPVLLLCLTAFSALAAEQFQNEQAAQQHCPDDTVVWLNLRSGNVHTKDMKWYGKTQDGAYVCKKKLAQGKAKAKTSERRERTAWRKVMEDDARAVYASPAPLEKKGDRATIVSLVDLRKATTLGTGKEFLSWETQYEFDCRQRQSRIVAASMYAANMGEGEVTDSVIYEAPEWEAIPKGSNGETLWKLACGNK
jgi:hypothetical protein